MCKGCGCGQRECCAPIIPPSEKAQGWRIGLIVLLVLQIIVAGVKIYFMGFGSGITDIAACVILVMAIVRYDYCHCMIYIIIALFEIFALIVVLGYYLQTDCGQNVPKKPGEADDKGGDGGEGGENGQKKHSMKSLHKSSSKRPPIIVMFRNLFDQLLRMKYSFYQTHAMPMDNSDDLPKDHTNIQLGSGDDEDKTQKLSKKYGPTFIITFCSALLLFYIIGCFIAHQTYREFKGVAEDIAGGSINDTDPNVLHYAVIDKREDDAIEEREEKEKRVKERLAAKLGMMDEEQPMMMDEEQPMMMDQ